MIRNLIMAGVGGQGTILASKLVADAALAAGEQVHTAETIGMAQRGGSVVSHIRIGEGVYSPLVPMGTACGIVAFEPAEGVRAMAYLAPGGTVVTNAQAIQPLSASLNGYGYDVAEMLGHMAKHAGRVIVVDGDAVCAEAGSPKVLNVALLGAASVAGVLGLTLEQLAATLERRLPQRLLEMNMTALHAGARYAKGD